MTIAAFAAHEANHLQRLELELLAQTYTPAPLKVVNLGNRYGRQRQIGVPCVADHVVQQAMLRVLGPHFEPTFCDCSYGFRTGRNAHQTVQAVVKQIRQGLTWMVEADIEACFDTLAWPQLRDALAARLPDDVVLDLIHRLMLAGGFSGSASPNKGVPQGTGCSPLLANVYLTPFDRIMMSRGGGFVRYGGDMVALHHSRRAATAALAAMRQCLEGDLHLRLHPGKTRITQARRQGFDFLSFRFTHTALEPSPEALRRFQ
jgi:group II intron reverse transcriptase/maturase